MKLKIAPNSIDWWYWLLTLISMVIGLLGMTGGFHAVVAISIVQFFHFLIRNGISALSTQVRLVYATLAILAFFDPTRILYWVLLVGTTMVTFFDRCFIAKVLLLMPWNKEPKPG
jgi:hypothetical protein